MWSRDVVRQVRAALEPLADPVAAVGTRQYMKDVAPFLGIRTPARRAAERQVWRRLAQPDERELVAAADTLWALPEREYQYAAAELLGRFRTVLSPESLERDLRRYLTTKAWWDTVDLLGSQAVNPLVQRYGALVEVMWAWNRSDDQWLVRTSIQHQRGLGDRTDVALLLALCEQHVADRRFFVSKAIGWALRDLTRDDPAAVERFVADHPDLGAVARREARRGLARVADPAGRAAP